MSSTPIELKALCEQRPQVYPSPSIVPDTAQAYLRDIMGLLRDHRNEVNVTIK